MDRRARLRPRARAGARHAPSASATRSPAPSAPPSEDERLGVLTAHPDLAGKLAAAKRLTAESTAEQAGAGLDALTDAERAKFTALNDAYQAKFGFPFIIAVRDHDKAGILAAFERRVANDRDTEFAHRLRPGRADRRPPTEGHAAMKQSTIEARPLLRPARRPAGADRAPHRPRRLHRGLRRHPARGLHRHRHEPAAASGRGPAPGSSRAR